MSNKGTGIPRAAALAGISVLAAVLCLTGCQGKSAVPEDPQTESTSGQIGSEESSSEAGTKEPETEEAETEEMTAAEALTEEPIADLYDGDGVHPAYLSTQGGEFRPDEPLLRGELADMLFRLLEDRNGERDYPADVAEDHPYREALGVLTALGAFEPDEDGFVYPDEAVSRLELLDILNRFLPSLAEESGESRDLSEEAVTRAEAVEIINDALGRSMDPQEADDYVIPLYTDVSSEHPAYYEIIEAAVGHSAEISGEDETWTRSAGTGYEPGLVLVGANLYYIDWETQAPIRDAYLGSLYFGPDGQYTSGDEELDGYVETAVAGFAEEGESRWELLYDAYAYTRDSFSYLRRNYYDVGETGWEYDEALTMFETGRGNCYSYASVFCCLARALGYDAEVVSGLVGSDRLPHGWVDIVVDGVKLLFDPELEMAHNGRGENRDLFALAQNELPWRYIYE